MKEFPYVSLKACPVCGEHPDLEKHTLERGRGGGYPGHFTYQYRCGYCKLLVGEETQDIYDKSPEIAQNRAKTNWNSEVERIEKIMLQAQH